MQDQNCIIIIILAYTYSSGYVCCLLRLRPVDLDKAAWIQVLLVESMGKLLQILKKGNIQNLKRFYIPPRLSIHRSICIQVGFLESIQSSVKRTISRYYFSLQYPASPVIQT